MAKLKHAAARSARWAAALVLATTFAGGAWAQSAASTPSVADAQTLTAQLAADLASQPSATQVLRQWCEQRQLADPAQIVAERQTGHDKPASAEVRSLLQAAPDEPIRYRRVALACGGRVLSRADNWYRPGQLTAAMNTALDTTDTPFGVVVQPLQFHRQSLEAKLLIKLDALKVPAEIVRNRALLETPGGAPFSLVVETYSRTLLDFGPKAERVRRPRVREPREPRTVMVEPMAAAPRTHHRRDAVREDKPPHHRDRSAGAAQRVSRR